MEQDELRKKQKKKKVLIAGLGTITAGVLGFFGWQWWKDRSESGSHKSSAPNATPNNGGNSPYMPNQDTANSRPAYHAPAPSPSSNDGFPLKKGSRGAKVKALQQALMNRYGASVLPRYGADGSFGNEVIAALAKQGLPSSIDESTYNALVGSNTANSNSNTGNSSLSDSVASDIAKAIDASIGSKKVEDAVAALKRINSIDDYKKVDKVFESTYSYWGTIWFVSKSIPTALMDTFLDENSQVSIRLELTRIGLKYDGKKFALSGLPYKLLTNKASQVMDKNGKTTAVAGNVLLGNPIGIRDGWVYFFPFKAEVLLRIKKSDVTISNNQ